MEYNKTTLDELEYKFTDIEITPRRGFAQSPYMRILDEFMLSGKKTCLITLKHPEKQHSVIASLRGNAKKHNIPVSVGRYGLRQIYLVKTEV